MRRREALTVLAIVLGWLVFIWGWEPSVLTLTVDDSFYALKTALNVARGSGLTFDGIHPTNGFHPLWMAVLVPVAAIVGPEIDPFVRVVLTLQVGLVVVGVRWLLGPFVERGRSAAWAIVALLFVAFYFTKIFVNGLESALELAAIGATTAFVARLESRGETAGPGEAVTLGVLCGLTTLARLDAVAFAVPVLVLHARSRTSRRGPSAVLPAVGAFVPVVAYAGWNIARFGHWLPINAALKGVADGPVGVNVLVAALIVALEAGVAAALFRSYRGRPQLRVLAGPLVVYVVAESAYDAGVRGMAVPEIWYLVPHACLVLLVVAEAWRVLESSPHRRAVLGLVGAIFCALVAVTWRARLRPESFAAYTAARRAGEWVSQKTPPGAVIAGWDCGIAAAYSHRAFMNLDGLISSWRFKEEFLDRGRVQELIERVEPVDYIVQPVPIEDLEPGGPVVFAGGVDLSAWRVVHAECFGFQSILSTRPSRYVELVLARRGEGLSLREWASSGPEVACSRGRAWP